MQIFYCEELIGFRQRTPFMLVYFYYVDGLLVDAGSFRFRLIPALKKLKIKQVAVTHHHRDHYGMVPWIARHHRVPIYIAHSQKHKTTFCKRDRTVPWIRSYPDVIQTDRFRFFPVSTPGHTPDHTCLYEPERGWLFTGDLYVTPRPKVCLRSESITNYISSLQRVLELDFETVFCAHQGVIQNGRERMSEKLDYLQTVQYEAIQLHRAGFSERAIAKRLFPKKAKLERVTFGTFSSIHFVRSCLEGEQ